MVFTIVEMTPLWRFSWNSSRLVETQELKVGKVCIFSFAGINRLWTQFQSDLGQFQVCGRLMENAELPSPLIDKKTCQTFPAPGNNGNSAKVFFYALQLLFRKLMQLIQNSNWNMVKHIPIYIDKIIVAAKYRNVRKRWHVRWQLMI